jgi:serine/threonine protein kinase
MAGLEGTQLGSCRVLHRIGGGGMGDIYLADQPGLGRQVAVKVVRGEGSLVASDEAKEQARQQFLQEAQAIATLDHPNILPVYEYGEQDGIHYLVMPYLPNGSLADLLVAGSRPTGLLLPLAYATVTHIILQAAEALQYAHDHGVIHRDVKPQNLLVRLLNAWEMSLGAPQMYTSGVANMPPVGAGAGLGTDAQGVQILLADFGLARFMALLVGRTGTIGTPLYSAPEQYSGYPVPATDQYALAGIAYLLLTGQHVFNGTVVELHHQHLTVMPTPPTRINPALPPAVDTMLLRALAKDPAQRFPSVRAFARALQGALTGGTVYTTWPQPLPPGAVPGSFAPTPAQPDSLLMPTPRVTDAPYAQAPGPTGSPFAPISGAAEAPTPPMAPPYGTPPAPAGAPFAPQFGTSPASMATPPAPMSPAPDATPWQQRPFVPTAPRSPAPAPYLTPTGPWRADADAPGAPLPRRPKMVQTPFQRPIQLTRKVVLIAIAVVLVLASLSGLALHFIGAGGATTGGQPGRTVLVGSPGILGQALQLPRSGVVTVSSLRTLNNGSTPRAESALSSRRDQANAGLTHLSALTALPATVPGITSNGSSRASQQVAVPQLVLAGAGQPDVGVNAPMDTSVGANGQYVVEALDGLIHIASVNGTPNATRNVDAADLFSSVLHSGDVLGAPRLLFDQTSGHWLLVFDEFAVHGGAESSGYLDIAISTGSSPLASWYVYQLHTDIPAHGGCTWADYPQIGGNSAAYYLSASFFACGAKGAFVGTALWEAPKAALQAGGTATVFQWTGFVNDTHRPTFSLIPAVESNAAATTEWLASTDAGYVDNRETSQRLNVWAVVHQPVSANGTQTIALVRVSVSLPYAYADPPAAAQRGTSALLATGDARISSLMFTGGHLYTAFTTAVNWRGDSRTRAGVYWLDLGPAIHGSGSASQLPTLTVGVLQASIFGFAGGYTMYPALVADSVGNVFLAASAASTSMNAGLIFGSRKKSDPASVLDEGRTAELLQSGSKPFTVGQWGDYSSASLLNGGTSGPETIWFASTYTDHSPAFWRTGLWQFGVS